MGVGPEQNFTYIAALKPAMAFIVDIRHGNLDVHLMYKALFEMSANRVEFVSKLFSLKPPPGVSEQSTARELITAFASITEFNDDLYKANLQAVINHLQVKRGFPLSEGDLQGIEWAMSNYYNHGLFISYNSSQTANAPRIVGAMGQGGRGGGGGGGGVRYMDLMIATDGVGVERSYLASEENFMVLKNLHMKNLLVPVVGDFGGSKALRAVGKYIKDAGGMVSAFYLSNVEQYLGQDGKTTSFLSNVATLPIDDTSRFISSGSGGRGGGGGMGSSMLRNMYQESRPYVEQ
jgi:hypothetical protein